MGRGKEASRQAIKSDPNTDVSFDSVSTLTLHLHDAHISIRSRYASKTIRFGAPLVEELRSPKSEIRTLLGPCICHHTDKRIGRSIWISGWNHNRKKRTPKNRSL